MGEMLGQLLKMVFGLLFFCVKALFLIGIPFFVMIMFYLLYYRTKGKRLPKRKIRSLYKRMPFIYRLFIDFPKRFVLDLYGRDPDKFPMDGLHLFAGEQGSGKTMAAVELMLRMKKVHPGSVVESNINIDFQDGRIQGWEDIVFHSNGTDGIMIFIDEIQNWFNSNESKNFPPDMIQEICQLRKQIKCIVATSQVFGRVAKPIREQVRVLYKPITMFGCLTIVRAYKPFVKQDGSLDKLRRIKTYFFIHDDELRSAYDTYEKVERLIKKGFKPISERINSETDETIKATLTDKK